MGSGLNRKPLSAMPSATTCAGQLEIAPVVKKCLVDSFCLQLGFHLALGTERVVMNLDNPVLEAFLLPRRDSQSFPTAEERRWLAT